jgi:hypothetical protein
MMTLTIKGIDSHNRPVYEDNLGRRWKDTQPDHDRPPRIYSALNDDFNGEPDIPYHGKVCFYPCRVVWKPLETYEV